MYYYMVTFFQVWEAMQYVVDQFLEEDGVQFSSKPTTVIGIHRGGAIPAGMVSYLLGNAGGISGISYSSHTGKGDDKNHTLQPNDLSKFANQRVLLVDDVCDSGHTMLELSQMLEQQGCTVYTAVIHYKRHVAENNSQFVPDFWWQTIEDTDECWIFYPWENET